MRIAHRIELEEAVAPDSRRVVRDERVLAPPAAAVARVVRVEEDQPSVAVGRRAHTSRAEAVDRLSVVRVLPEQLVEATAVDPVGPRVELRDRAGPVRDVQLPGALLREPRDEAEIGQSYLPGLQRPA